MTRNFRALLEAKWNEGKFVCVGLDTDPRKIPPSLLDRYRDSHDPVGDAMYAFNRAIIVATSDLVLAYKPNSAFYEREGVSGWGALRRTCEFTRSHTPHTPIVLDIKRGDIGNTNEGYVHAAFTEMEADAVTVSPYLGSEALKPFLEMKDKGVIVICRTSNKGAGEFQDLPVQTDWAPDGTIPLYQYVAMKVAKDWDENNNCAVVVGATYPGELAEVRRIVGDLPILIPGIGAQGGDVEATVKAGKDSNGKGMIINVSRSVLYASSGEDFAEAARAEVERVDALIRAVLKEEVAV